MNKLKLLWLVAASIGFCGRATFAATPLDIQCGIVHDSFTFGYCIHQVKGSVNSDVLYSFHRAGSSEYEWQHTSQNSNLYDEWGSHAPTVITVSYGNTWLLAEKNTSPQSGLLEHFIQNAIPILESLLSFTPLHRLLIGTEMGGFNAIQLYFKAPQLFSRIALLNPSISAVGPYDDEAMIDRSIQKTGADPQRVRRQLYFTSTYFPTQADWKNADPISLALQKSYSTFPALWVSSDPYDRQGFFEGTQMLINVIQEKGGLPHWTKTSGRKDLSDLSDAALFLIKPF